MADAAIILFWLIGLVRGVFRGAVKGLLSIVGTIGGLAAAAWLHSPLAAFLPGGFGTASLRRMIVFLLVFGAIYLLFGVVSIVAAYLMRLRATGWLNRIIGAGMGMLNAALVVAVLVVPLVVFYPQRLAWLERSDISAVERRLAAKVLCVTPTGLNRQFASHNVAFDRLRRDHRIGTGDEQ